MSAWLVWSLVAPSWACPDPSDALMRGALQLALNRLSTTEVELGQVRDSLACRETVDPQLVARYFQLEGVLARRQAVAPGLANDKRIELERSSRLAFAAARRIDPEYWDADLGKGADYKAFMATKPLRGREAAVVLAQLQDDDWVSIDGARIEPPLLLPPGFHVVQVGSEGQAARFGRVFEVLSGGSVRMEVPLPGTTVDWRDVKVEVSGKMGARVDFPEIDRASCTETSPPDVEALLRRAETELTWQRTEEVPELTKALDTTLVCNSRVVQPIRVARYARLKSILALDRGETDVALAWVRLSRALAPELAWLHAVAPDHPVRTLATDDDEQRVAGLMGRSLVAPDKGGVFLNGEPLAGPTAPEGLPGLVQVADRRGKVVSAHWQFAGEFPEALVGPPGPPLSAPGWFEPADAEQARHEVARWYNSLAPDATPIPVPVPPPPLEVPPAAWGVGVASVVVGGLGVVRYAQVRSNASKHYPGMSPDQQQTYFDDQLRPAWRQSVLLMSLGTAGLLTAGGIVFVPSAEGVEVKGSF